MLETLARRRPRQSSLSGDLNQSKPPPETSIQAPVMKDAASDISHRIGRATSSAGDPTHRNGRGDIGPLGRIRFEMVGHIGLRHPGAQRALST